MYVLSVHMQYTKFFQERGFVYVHTPLITGSDCEGAGEMFQVTTMDLNNIPTDDKGKYLITLRISLGKRQT